MYTPRSKINYIGYVYHGNLGDDAAFKVIQGLFNRYQFIPFVPSIKRRFIRINETLSQITIFGGGTLLPHLVPYVPKSRYNYAFGVGVRNPMFWGKFDSAILDRMQSFDFRFLGVRGNISRNLLKDWGFESKVIGDPCLSLKDILQNKIKKK